VTTVIVVDASVLAVALGADGERGSIARERLRREILAAPELIDLEVLSVFRRHVATGTMTAQRAEAAMVDLIDVPLRRGSHRPLLKRSWELRHNLTSYDACYVALAETLEVTLLTADGRLARAPGLHCAVELLE
jgi:predicted nucleic acid-binding protein